MKTSAFLKGLLLTSLSLSLFWLMGCSKSSPDPGKHNSKKELTVTVSKVNSAPHDPPINSVHTCYHDGKIYVLDGDYTNAFDPATKVFMSYDIAGNAWKALQGPVWTDYPTGKLNYNEQLNAIIAIGYNHEKYTYATEDYFIASNKNKWFVQDIPLEFQTQSGAYSYGNGKVYGMGNNMFADGRLTLVEYGINWKSLLTIDEKFTGARYQNSVFHGKNMYIIADVDKGTTSSPKGYVFNTESLTVEEFEIPDYNSSVQVGISYHHMAVYRDVLLVLNMPYKTSTGAINKQYQLSGYNTKTKTWCDKAVLLPTDFLNSNNADLYVTQAGKIYAVGIKNNNFAIYELKVNLPEGW